MTQKRTLRLSLALGLLLLGLCLPAHAQRHRVSGTVVDTVSHHPLPFASIALQTDTTVRALGLTDAHGAFVLPVDSAGTYRLRVSYVGYAPLERTLRLLPTDTLRQLGRLGLRPDAKGIHLKGADVVGMASSLTIREDTFVYSSKAMILNPGETLSAMISQMPGVKMDKDGNLTWQGKKVESLLIDGKRFFGGDIKTALQNLPAEMIENLKLYDKKSDETERSGIDDGKRTTVIDVGIKREYQGSWKGTFDAAGGHESKWLGRAFLLRFSDRLRMSAATNNNNLNGDVRVDENGNWYMSGFRLGWARLHSANFDLSWNNKDDKRAAGYQIAELSVRYNRSHTDQRADTWQENFLPGEERVWWMERNRTNYMEQGISASAYYSANIDSLTQFHINASIDNSKNHNDGRRESATLNINPEELYDDNALNHLLAGDLPESVRQQLVNTMDKRSSSRTRRMNYYTSANLSHRFARTQNQISLIATTMLTRNPQTDYFNYYDGRTYAAGVPTADLNRQYAPQPNRSTTTGLSINYRHHIAQKLWWSIGYSYTHMRQSASQIYYRTDMLDGWDDLSLHPIDQLPPAGAELDATTDGNTNHTTLREQEHNAYVCLSGQAGRWEPFVSLSWRGVDSRYAYNRPSLLDTVVNRFFSNPYFIGRLRYKFTNRTSLSASYTGRATTPSMDQLLDVSNTADPQTTSVGNPDLRSSWNNNARLELNTFLEPHQTSLWANINWDNTRHASTRIMRYNPATGYYTWQPTNINGQWNTYANVGLSTNLDQKNEWTLSMALSGSYNEAPAYVSTIGQQAQRNTIKTTNMGASFSLSFRRRKFSGRINASINPQRNRNTVQKESDEDRCNFSYGTTLSYTTPFGLSLGTDFTTYSRRGYRAKHMNDNQLIWNANIAQTLLKGKNLTLKLEGVDLLATRTADYASFTATANSIVHYNSFKRYVVMHAIYRFNVGKKKTDGES